MRRIYHTDAAPHARITELVREHHQILTASTSPEHRAQVISLGSLSSANGCVPSHQVLSLDDKRKLEMLPLGSSKERTFDSSRIHRWWYHRQVLMVLSSH